MKRNALWLLTLMVFASGCTSKQNKGPSVRELSPADGNVVAMIGEEKVTEETFIENLPNEVRGEFSKQQQAYREAKEAALSEMVFNMLLDKEAEKKSVSKNEILEENVGKNLPEISDQDVQSFYDNVAKQYESMGRPAPELNDSIRSQIRMTLSAQNRADKEREYAEELFAKYDVAFVLPEPVRFSIDPGTLPAKGKEGAKVTVIEFSDFHCPFCRRGSDNMKEVMKDYGDKIEYRYRDFPLEQIHPRAKAASMAARCADDQGKFWAYHDKVFSNQDKKENEDFVAFAKELSLDVEQFETCLNDEKFKAQVEADIQAGRNAGVTGTPAYFINGIFISGAVPPEKLKSIIDKELM